MDALQQRLQKALEKRKEDDSFRKLVVNDGLIDFSSNDYLGFSRNAELSAQIDQAYLALEMPNVLGATGSRLISGHSHAID
ncbi:MAG: 8-amino-7-oxononanoate synthase, partial [Cytophagales bacterium]|nr:8-amino-7-oxononanoate synthase [Cytophagales bacterium]